MPSRGWVSYGFLVMSWLTCEIAIPDKSVVNQVPIRPEPEDNEYHDSAGLQSTDIPRAAITIPATESREGAISAGGVFDILTWSRSLSWKASPTTGVFLNELDYLSIYTYTGGIVHIWDKSMWAQIRCNDPRSASWKVTVEVMRSQELRVQNTFPISHTHIQSV